MRGKCGNCGGRLEKIAATMPELKDNTATRTVYLKCGKTHIYQALETVTFGDIMTSSSRTEPYTGNLSYEELKTYAPKMKGAIYDETKILN